ncbi:hypothetical protein [Streptomyces sp. NPDC056061]|uniref:hypothetical protein n=1 Tax=Streptomyces sp. NPDC056061 TaxID=3345700 RepID=UPI0035D5E1F5
MRREIDSDEGVSPVQAAPEAWQKKFRRDNGQRSNEDACVSTSIIDAPTGRSIEIDLSDKQHAQALPLIEPEPGHRWRAAGGTAAPDGDMTRGDQKPWGRRVPRASAFLRPP